MVYLKKYKHLIIFIIAIIINIINSQIISLFGKHHLYEIDILRYNDVSFIILILIKIFKYIFLINLGKQFN